MLAAFGILVAVGVNMVNLKDKDSANVRNDSTLKFSVERIHEVHYHVHMRTGY